MESDSEDLSAVRLQGELQGRAAHIHEGLQAVGLVRVGLGVGKGDGHHLVAAGAGYEGLRGVRQNYGVGCAGAIAEGRAGSPGSEIDDADTVLAAVGHDQGFAVRCDAGRNGLFACGDLGNFAPCFQVDDRD